GWVAWRGGFEGRPGGVGAWGSGGAAVVHVLLAVLVLGIPCTLMGGTLPAAVKWVETNADVQRGATGALYGGNTLGAVTGVVLSTFWLLERTQHNRSEEHTSELQSLTNLVCRLLLEKKKKLIAECSRRLGNDIDSQLWRNMPRRYVTMRIHVSTAHA